jgi:hypothetical protein
LLKRATLPISIREWLCVGCQSINDAFRLDPGDSKACLAYYKHNSFQTIFPQRGQTPPGPAAFICGIQRRRGNREFAEPSNDKTFARCRPQPAVVSFGKTEVRDDE